MRIGNHKCYIVVLMALLMMMTNCSKDEDLADEIVETDDEAAEVSEIEADLPPEEETATNDDSESETVVEDNSTNSEITQLVEEIDSSQEQVNDSGLPYSSENTDLAEYVVQPGETLSLIAKRIYDKSSYWGHLAQINQISNPSKIFPGDIIKYEVNETTSRFHNIYTNLDVGSIVVAQGDSLSSIAQKVFGEASYWRSMWRANPNLTDPNRIFVGQTLRYRDPVKLRLALGEPQPEHGQIEEMPQLQEKTEIEKVAEQVDDDEIEDTEEDPEAESQEEVLEDEI